MSNNKTESERDQPGDFSLGELIVRVQELTKYLLSKWMIILAFLFLGGAIGAVYAWVKAPVFSAETTFVLEDEGSGGGVIGQLGGLAGLAGIDVGSGEGLFQGDNILELYKSRSMIEKTLLSFADSAKSSRLINRYIEINKLDQEIPELRDFQFHPQGENRLRDSIISLIITDINRNYLIVSRPDKKLSIISVKVKSSDELFAKQFTDQIVGNVNAFYVETKTKKSLENIKILQQKTDSVRAVMNGAIYSSAAGIDATPNLNPTRQVLRAPSEKSKFDVETSKTILGELIRNLELTKMTLLKETPLIQIIDRPVLPLSKSQTSILKGVVMGALISGMLAILTLLCRYIIRQALKVAKNSVANE